MAENDSLFPNPITNARVNSEPAQPTFNKLPAFPAIDEIPGTGAPERVVTQDGVQPSGESPQPAQMSDADRAQAAVDSVTPFEDTQPVNVLPFDANDAEPVNPVTVAQPGETPQLMQLQGAGATVNPAAALTQGEDASFATVAGDRGVTPVLPNPFRQQVLSPNVLYGNAAEGVTARQVISTDILNTWRPHIRALNDQQRAQAEAERVKLASGANIRDEVNGNLDAIDLVNSQLFRRDGTPVNEDARERILRNRTGLRGIGEAIGAQLGQWFGLDPEDKYPQGFSNSYGDFGNGALGALIQGVSNFQNSVYGTVLDAANGLQAGARALANTPLDWNDLSSDARRYMREFYRDGDDTNYRDRAARGDDLGFSNYGRMRDGTVNPLGMWGTEGSSEFANALQQITLTPQTFARDRYGVPTQGAVTARERLNELRGNGAGLALGMGVGLLLDVLLDPSDVAKAIARFRGGSVAARSLGEAVQMSSRARRGVNTVSEVAEVVSTEAAEAVQAVQTSQRVQASVPPVPQITRVNTESTIQVMPQVTPPQYYSPSTIVNSVIGDNVAAPTYMRGTPEFVTRSAADVAEDVLTAAPALRAELGAVPLRSLATVDSVVAATVRATGSDALNIVPNVLAPVNRQAPQVITELAGDGVKLDPEMLAATLPRNVGNASRTRIALYNNVDNTLTAALPATTAPQRVYVQAPDGLVNNPMFPVSIDAARPLIDEIAATGKSDSLMARANKYLQSLARQGYVQRTPDYSAFVTSTKNTDIAYTNLDNLVKVDDGVAALRGMSDDYVKLAADTPKVYRQTRLLEVLAPSAQRTPDMFVELATGYAGGLPKVPTRDLARGVDTIIAAEDRYSNAAQLLQRVEGEVANVDLGLRNTTFETGFINRTGTVQRLSNGNVLRKSKSAGREVTALRELADVEGLPRVQLDVKNAEANTYTVDGLPKDAVPLVKNGALNITLEELDDVIQRVDDVIVNMAEKGYVHFDVVNSTHVLADGSIRVSDNVSDMRKINDIFYGAAEIDEIEEVMRVERSLARDQLERLRETFDSTRYELGNQPQYDNAMFDNALARSVYEYDGAPSSLANANKLRYQTKYELQRAAQLAQRELEAAMSARDAAINKFRDSVNTYNTRSRALQENQLRAKQRKFDAELSRDRGECL